MGTKREHQERARRHYEADNMTTAELIAPGGRAVWSAKKAAYVPIAYASVRDLGRVLSRIGQPYSRGALKATYGPPSMRRAAERVIRQHFARESG